MSPRIAVLGTGANGAGIAADLVRAGHDVTLIDQWPENVAAIREHGVRVEMPADAHTTRVRVLHLCEVATLRERFDLVFVLVKAYDTRWACELIKPYLSEDALVVGLQNGMSVDDLAEVIGAERVVAGVIEVTAAMYEPGLVERHTPPSGSWFALGGVHPRAQDRAATVAPVLAAAGTVQVVKDIRSAKWMKLAVNAAELVPSAILDLPLLEARSLPGMHDFMLTAGREAIRTAVDLGFGVVPIFGLTDVDPDRPEAFLDIMLGTVYEKWSLPQTRTTVLQDWMKGRRSEVEEINGLVVGERHRLGGTAQANAVTLEIAREIEGGVAEAGQHHLPRLLAGIASE